MENYVFFYIFVNFIDFTFFFVWKKFMKFPYGSKKLMNTIVMIIMNNYLIVTETWFNLPILNMFASLWIIWLWCMHLWDKTWWFTIVFLSLKAKTFKITRKKTFSIDSNITYFIYRTMTTILILYEIIIRISCQNIHSTSIAAPPRKT